MNKRSIRIVALLLLLCSVFSIVSISVFAAELDLTLKNESVVMDAAQPSRSIAVFTSAFTIMRCVEYLGKSLKSINAVVVAAKADKPFAEICDIAIDAFLGRKRDDNTSSGGGTDFTVDYSSMTAEIKSIHTKLTDLENGISEINNSIQELNNTIIAEANRSYVNEFRKEYIDLANDMLDEYEQLVVTLKNDDKSIDSVKRDYDDLYIASARLNNMLYEYMTGNYRDDGLSIYEVMYEYVDGTSGKSQEEIYERCIGFSEELYATYALSQYYRLLCCIYQMEYCDYYALNSYVTENEAPESLPRDSIVTAVTRMESRYETIVTDVARYIVECGNYNMNMLYVPAVTEEIYPVTFSELRNLLRVGDKYYFTSSFPDEFNEMFLDTPITFTTTDESIATIGEDGELILTGNTGNFTLSMKYRDNVLANYPFTVRDNVSLVGYGIASAPYLVSTVDELLAATKNIYSHIKLLNNLNLTDTTYNNNVITNYFDGVLDGNGYSIYNVKIQDTGSTLVGFFRELSNNAVIKNLTLAAVTITKGTGSVSPSYFGILCAYNKGTIYNCSVENSRMLFSNFTSGTPYKLAAGGVVGVNYGTIENTMSFNFKFDGNSIKYNGYINKEYDICIGGLAGVSGSGAVLRYNLVKGAIINYYATFTDSYKSGSYSIKNSIGFAVGNRNTSASEALYYQGTLNGSVKSELYLTSVTTSDLPLDRYIGTSAASISDLTPYRVIRSNYSTDRDVYSELVLASAPQRTDVPYGGVLNLSGIILEVKYANGTTARVPVDSLSGLDPNVYGEQTVTVYATLDRGTKTLSTTFTVTVVCPKHEWELDSVIVAPTCTTSGTVKNVCTLCGETVTVSVSDNGGHDYVATVTNPTCESDGYTTHTCSRCQSSYVDTPTNALGHNYVSVITKPTCEAGGYTTHTCSRCQSSYRDTPTVALGHTAGTPATCTTPQQCTACATILVSALGHTAGAPATCTTAQKCTVCSVTLTAALGHKPGASATCESDQKCTSCDEILNTALGHNYVSVITKPTCEAGGYTTHTCSRCQSSYRDTPTVALGHTAGTPATCTTPQQCTTCATILVSALGHTAGAPATCTTAQKCTVCSITLTAALGHKPGASATCESDQKCTSCDTILNTALGHNYVSVITKPTCEVGGYTTHTCSRCQSSYRDTPTVALGHTAGTPATCTDAQRCTACNTVLSAAFGHTAGSPATCTTAQTCVTCNVTLTAAFGHTAGAPATCTAPQKCTACDEILNTAKGHDYVPVITAPNCISGGYTTHTCSRCSSSYVSDPTEITDHTAGAPATCEAAQKCTVCDEILNDPLGHSYNSAVTPPTCLTDGYTTYTCSRCQSSYVDDLTEKSGHTSGGAATCESAEKCTVCKTVLNSALGHEYSTVVTPPACTKQGYTTYSCIRCSSSYVDNYTTPTGHTLGTEADCVSPQICTVCTTVIADALGHEYTVDVIAPTCLNKGYTMHTCTRCLNSYNDTFLDKTDHAPSGWIIDVSPTVGASGSEHTECIYCREVLERRDIAPLTSEPNNTTDGGDEKLSSGNVLAIVLISLGGAFTTVGVVLIIIRLRA